jgi:hypothetical protein
MNALLNRLKSILELSRIVAGRLIARFEAEPGFRFYVLAVSFFAVLVAGSVLTHSNPFRLLGACLFLSPMGPPAGGSLFHARSARPDPRGQNREDGAIR